MTDEKVDELLKDLDAALSVEPSPAVAARVRTRIDEPPARHPFAWTLSTVGVLAMAVVVYGLWRPGESVTPNASQQTTSTGADTGVADHSTPEPLRSDETTVRSTRASHLTSREPAATTPGASVRTLEFSEPEVLVSPQVASAFEQLQAAALAGRVTDEFFTSSRPLARPFVVTPKPVEIHQVGIDVVPGRPDTIGGPKIPGGSEGDRELIWPNRPLSRTRSAS